mmetsp:Transcript_104/g.118  ORF Transcript_104/g.118 Transcript_104/m.118 type:complete len:165 (-) Transcript_104:9-503(-)
MLFRFLLSSFLLSQCIAFGSIHSSSRRTSLGSTFDPENSHHPVLERNNKQGLWFKQQARPRRNRKSEVIRSMVRENFLSSSNLINPMFIHDGESNEEIESMPGVFRLTLSSMLNEVDEAMKLGIKTFLLFPKVPEELKTNLAEESYNPNGIVHRAISLIKTKFS